MNDLTVAELIEQLKKMPPDAVVVYEDYDTSNIYGVGGFLEESLTHLKYVNDVRSDDPLIDYSHYEHDGDIACVILYL